MKTYQVNGQPVLYVDDSVTVYLVFFVLVCLYMTKTLENGIKTD